MFYSKNITFFIVFTFQIYSSFSFSSNIPPGFEELFEIKESMVRVRNLDGTLTTPIPFLTSFNILKLDSKNKDAIERVSNYLEMNSIDVDYRQEIIEELLRGIEDGSQCLGKLDECEIYPEKFEIVHNYNDQEMYLFVSPKVLSFVDNIADQKYHSSISQYNGLINSFDLYVSDYSDQNSNISLNDQTILGLPYGYIKSDFNINNSESGSDLYEAAYHLDIDAFTAKIGHFEFDPRVNSTDYLNNTTRLGQNSITVGTSEKLLMGGQNSDKILSFYVPTSGTVQLYRDERLIYQNNVSEGENSISYNALPSGRYEVVLEVSSGGQVVNTQNYQVYNTKNDTLATGDIDFAITTGSFSGSHYDYSGSDILDVEDDFYGKGLFNYQLTRSLQLGLGGLITEQGTMYSLGGVYSLLEFGLNSEVVYSQFDDASHINANVGISSLSLSYESLDNENGDSVASYLYGYSDYSRFSLNSSYGFGRGKTIYAVYSLYNEKMLDPSLGNNEQQQFVSVGYSTPAILDSQVNLNIDYSDINDDTSFNILWSIPLSSTIDVITGVTSNKSGVSQFKTTMRKNRLIASDSFSTSLEASNTYDRQQSLMYQDALLSTSGYTSYARINASAHKSTNGIQGINAGLSSTQIITEDDFYLTNKSSSAYALVDVNEVNSIDSNIEEKGYFTLKQEGKNNSQFIVYDNETIVPLNSYKSYEATFDSESVDLYNSGENKVNVYSHPGTVASMTPKVSRIVSFVSAFSDITERPLVDIECRGEGCIEVNEMTDGVYRVTVLEGLDFELSSNDNQCLLPYELTSTDQMNFGNNYCLPIGSDNEIHLITMNEQKIKAMFLGTYENSNTLDDAVYQLERLGYRVIKKDIGNLKAVYITVLKSIEMEKMVERNKNEISKIKSLARTTKKINSITYPLVLVK
ncbi:TcfC E-set like domain-containing protein [Vibrio apostichopi]|uniref:TcfC E-set like domain-containing protein n=1 Tax=Vibrio apostichopi TaxID=3035453 RepID=UPI00257254CA|nr:TcfC E-set like domain-containing protein [Vibrio sp. FE10]